MVSPMIEPRKIDFSTDGIEELSLEGMTNETLISFSIVPLPHKTEFGCMKRLVDWGMTVETYTQADGSLDEDAFRRDLALTLDRWILEQTKKHVRRQS